MHLQKDYNHPHDGNLLFICQIAKVGTSHEPRLELIYTQFRWPGWISFPPSYTTTLGSSCHSIIVSVTVSLPKQYHKFLRESRIREVKCLGQGGTVRKQPSMDLTQRFSRFGPVFLLPTVLLFHLILFLPPLSKNRKRFSHVLLWVFLSLSPYSSSLCTSPFSLLNWLHCFIALHMPTMATLAHNPHNLVCTWTSLCLHSTHVFKSTPASHGC